MKARTLSVKARPDTMHRERQWFSNLPVPAYCKRLSTGEPIDRLLFDRVTEGIAEAVAFLVPSHPYMAKYFVDGWVELSVGDRRRAGRCIAAFARSDGSPIGLIHRGGRQSHRYFIRPVSPQTPPQQTSTPQHHQS